MAPRALLAALLLALAAGPAVPAAGEPPAAPAEGAEGRGHALRSFERFAASWMEKMERAEAENRSRPDVRAEDGRTYVTYRGYGESVETELRATGSARAPYVGLLRYEEILFACADRSAERCRAASRTPVTEIFRYQDGRWVY